MYTIPMGTSIDRPNIGDTLLTMVTDLQNTQGPLDTNLRKISYLHHLIKLESEILNHTSSHLSQILNELVLNAIPRPIRGFELSSCPTTIETEDIMSLVPLLFSPILTIISQDTKDKLRHSIIELIWDEIHAHARHTEITDLPENFHLIKRIITNTHLWEMLREYQYSEESEFLRNWAFMNDISLLAYFKASDFFASLYLPMRKSLAVFLQENDIDSSIFWETVSKFPELPALDILELLTPTNHCFYRPQVGVIS